MTRGSSLVGLAVVGVAACGHASGHPDAGPGDCQPGFHLDYDFACVENCSPGTCGVDATCNPTSGACEYRSCFALKGVYQSLGDGPQPIRPVADEPAVPSYCSGRWTYVGAGLGDFNNDLGPDFAGYDQARVSDLQSVFTQQGLRWAYDRQSGLTNVAPGFSGAACCMKSAYDNTGDILLGGMGLTPANLDGTENCGGPYTDTAMRIAVGGFAATTPLADDFFTPGVTSGPVCAEGDNPAILVKRFTGLASCAAIRDNNLSEGSGIYVIDPDGLGPELPRDVVCDMAGAAAGTTIEDVAVGAAGGAYQGYTQVAVADLADPSVQLAFLLAVGRHGGLANLDSALTVGDCCFSVGAGAGYLSFGGAAVQIAHAAGGGCSGAYAEPIVGFTVGGTAQTGPLARDYFATRAIGSTPTCAASGNPALFIKRE